jgi:hypothetical protein
MKYRGYRRHVVPSRVLESREVSELLDRLEHSFRFTDIANYRRARVWISRLPAVISVPVISAVIGLRSKKPVVVIDDEKFIDEAVDMVNLLGAVAVVFSHLHSEFAKKLWKTADFPIIFAGRQPPQEVEYHSMDVTHVLSSYRRAVVSIIAQTYGISVPESQVRHLVAETEQKFYERLEELALTGRLTYPVA